MRGRCVCEVRTGWLLAYRAVSAGAWQNRPMPHSAATTTQQHEPYPATDPAVDALVREIIERIADKWTMLVLDELHEHGPLRFTELAHSIGGISQKMLAKTVRQMERDGLLTRTVFPVVPPHVEYRLTELGNGLGFAFCGVWIWAEKHLGEIEAARKRFAEHIERTQPWQTPRS